MADYWKSQAKKYCDFCKCWIADNKPSVEFHEKGKRHKENVEKRLKEISQKSRKEHKESLKVDSEMKKMEDAAMKAYLKDIEGEGDGDYTSQCIRREMREKEEMAEEENKKRQELLREERRIKDERLTQEDSGEKEEAGSSKEKVEEVVEKKTLPWYEAKSDEGYTYYWHIETGESVWEAPSEGFLSIAEQEEGLTLPLKEVEVKVEKEKEDTKIKQENLESVKEKEEDKAKQAEESAQRAREKMRHRAVKKEKKEITPFEPVVMGPAPRLDPYGGWKTVETTSQLPVDLQLPKQDYPEVEVPVFIQKERKFKFKEKTVGSLDGEGSSDFKKRKFNAGSKRNTRQRLDED